MKLLILILGARNLPMYDHIMNEGILKTWASRKYKNVDILPYYGGAESCKLTENCILVTAPDIGEEHIYDKTLQAFKVAYDNIDFDVILRTNISTFIRPDYLYSILKKEKLNNFFGSTWYHPADENCYFSGVSLLFSRDVIKVLIDKNIKNTEGEIDDVLIGNTIMKIYPNYKELYKKFKRLDVMENSILRFQDPLFKIKYSDAWAFRCKTMHNLISNREMDIKKMKLLDKIFYNE